MTDPPYRVVILHREGVPQELETVFAEASAAPPLLLLARGLASSPVWRNSSPGILVARLEPTPILAAIGHFDDADEVRLSALNHQLRTVLQRTVYLDHSRVEVACEALAERLLGRFGRDRIAGMQFVGVPRGGLIVLGMLSYALGLKRHQVVTGAQGVDVSGTLVVVDDCALSGLRIHQFLETRSDSDVVIATLFSHPDLRTSMIERLRQVSDVVSAYDLHDNAPRDRGEAYGAWRLRWAERSDPKTLWIGTPDHVCFPWGEPETTFWNPVTEREELGWQVIPPELCLKSRHGTFGGPLTAQLQQAGKGPLRPSARVVVGEIDGAVVIADLDTLRTYALVEVAAAMWRAVVAAGDPANAVATLLSEFDVEPDTLHAEMRAFVDELLVVGLLEHVAP
ncbi:MAG: PqqD family peptide modification chaperone [Gemmatimonadaceae bacterium]|nr:PqqD family peptide modification chaperone [Gemmatimonadaceae bacterium]